MKDGPIQVCHEVTESWGAEQMRRGCLRALGWGDPLVLGKPERLGACHAGSGGLGAGRVRLRKGEGGPCLCSGTIHPHSPVSPGDGGQRGSPTRSWKKRKPVGSGSSAEPDPARLLSLLHTPAPAAGSLSPFLSLLSPTSPRRSGAWDLRLAAAAAAAPSSGLFKPALNIHGSKNKRASHSPRSLRRDPQR